MAGFDAVFVGSGDQLARGRRAPREGRLARLRARAKRLARRRDQDRRGPDGAGVHARGLLLLAPALGRLAGLCRAEAGPRRARPRVPEHRPADGSRVPGRLERVPLDRRRRERRRARATRGSGSSTSSWPAPTSRSACSGPSSGRRQGSRSAARPTRSSAAAASSSSPGHSLLSARDWLTDTFEREQARGLLAPWVLHTGLGPDQAMSGFMTQVIACALQLGGMPVPKGGGVKLVEGLATIVRNAGGELRTEADVERILVSEGRATAVRLADGETIPASRAVLACVTPTQLYGRLLGEGDAPAHVRDAARRFRYGRGEMQIHIAMNELPRWRGDERLARTPLLHLTPGLDGVSRAVNEADRGLLPAEATIALGQPMAARSLARARRLVGDLGAAAGAAAAAEGRRGRRARHVGDGTWTEELREAYADRIVERIGRHIENLESATVAPRRHVARGHGGGEPELGRRRHLRRLVLARPEPPLPPHPRLARPRDAGRAALAHRREHAPRAGPRRGLRLPRREAADEAAARAAAAREGSRACRDALAERDLDRRGELPRRPARLRGRRASTGSGSGR